MALRKWDSNHKKSSLFERIQAEPDTAHNQSKTALILSIKRNLQHIFNARPGECHGSYELGIIDINDAQLNSEEIQNNICQSIKTCVEKFEPRVSHVDVQARQDTTTFCYFFSVTAHLTQINRHEKIEIDVFLNHNKLTIM